MNMALLRRCATALVLAGGVAGTSHALTVLELQSLLQSAPAHVVSFVELRESPWLATPIESRGTMHWTPGLLEKRVEAPRQETWRMLPDRVEWVGPGGTESKRILFSEVPAMAVLADALRRVVAGDLLALERDFKIELSGDDAPAGPCGCSRWAPRTAATSTIWSWRARGPGCRLSSSSNARASAQRPASTPDPRTPCSIRIR